MAMQFGARQQYVVLQVTLKEKFIGTGSGNLTELESVINRQAAQSYRLHTISTASGGSGGVADVAQSGGGSAAVVLWLRQRNSVSLIEKQRHRH